MQAVLHTQSDDPSDPRTYYGPQYKGHLVAVSGGAGSSTSERFMGFLDTIAFHPDDDHMLTSYDLTIVRAGETIYSKTGLTGFHVVHPRVLECKAEDGAALTTRCKAWLQNEVLTCTVANAGDVTEVIIAFIVLPN